MNKFLHEPLMIAEARESKKGHIWVIELLIFMLVFLIASLIESIPSFITMIVSIINNSEFIQSITDSIINGGEYSDPSTILFSGDFGTTFTLVALFSTALLLAVGILYCLWIEKRKPKTLGFRKGNIIKEYLYGLGLGLVMIVVAVGIAYATGAITFSIQKVNVGLLILYFIGYMIQGASEEVLCRGYLMVSIARKNPLWLAVLSSSAFFALLHIMNPGVTVLSLINIFIIGIVFSLYTIKRGNLWGACALHSIWNFVQGNIFGISVSGSGVGLSPLVATNTNGLELFNGGTFGIEGSLSTTIVCVLALAAIIFLIKYKKSEHPGLFSVNGDKSTISLS